MFVRLSLPRRAEKTRERLDVAEEFSCELAPVVFDLGAVGEEILERGTEVPDEVLFHLSRRIELFLADGEIGLLGKAPPPLPG